MIVCSGSCTLLFKADQLMNKKEKKRLEILRKKKTQLELRIAGTRQQQDEPDELQKLESELKAISEEIEKLKKS